MITVRQLGAAEGSSEFAMLTGVKQSSSTQGTRTRVAPPTKSNFMIVDQVQPQSMVFPQSPPSTLAIIHSASLGADEPEVISLNHRKTGGRPLTLPKSSILYSS